MEREAEQKYRGKRCAHAMPRNIDHPVQRKKDCRDQCGQSITLIRSFAQRKNFPEDKNESDNDENDGSPTKLGPKPEPVAFGMDRATIAVGCGTENSEDVFKIAKTDADPGRVANELKDIGKNPPSKIVRYVSAAEIVKVESFQCLAAKEKQDSE